MKTDQKKPAFWKRTVHLDTKTCKRFQNSSSHLLNLFLPSSSLNNELYYIFILFWLWFCCCLWHNHYSFCFLTCGEKKLCVPSSNLLLWLLFNKTRSEDTPCVFPPSVHWLRAEASLSDCPLGSNCTNETRVWFSAGSSAGGNCNF